MAAPAQIRRRKGKGPRHDPHREPHGIPATRLGGGTARAGVGGGAAAGVSVPARVAHVGVTREESLLFLGIVCVIVLNWQTCRMLWNSILKGYRVIPICDKSSLSTSYMIPKYVILSGNMLSGGIPSEIVAMNLSMLYLDDNAPSQGTFLQSSATSHSSCSMSLEITSQVQFRQIPVKLHALKFLTCYTITCQVNFHPV